MATPAIYYILYNDASYLGVSIQFFAEANDVFVLVSRVPGYDQSDNW